MQTTRILRFFSALLAAVSLSSAVQAGTIFADDFESGNLNNWTTTGTSPLTIANGTNVVPAGGANAALIDTSADRMHRNIIADNGGSEIAGHTVFSYWFYDNAGTATRVFNEIRGYAGGTGLPNGGSTASGSLAQLIAFGKYNSVTLPGDTAYNATKYQARAGFTTNATIYWFNLDGPNSPNRSVGWHKFTMEREAGGGTIHFYVDGALARTVTDAVNESLDSVILGFGAGTTVGDGWIDGVQISSGVPTITASPQSATVVAGGNVSFSVTQVGGVTYQWTHAGTNIPNANAGTLNLSGVHDGNAGDYAVIVGNTAGTTTSAIASLAVTHLPDIVFVSDNGPAGFSGPLAGTVDDAFVTLLQNAGHNVIRFNSDNSAAVLLTQAQVDALNTNDLIILGRSLGSGAFGPGQGSQWNTNITKPIIVQSPFLTRSGQLGWFVGSSAINNVPMPLTAVSPGDPENAYLFAGTTLNGATTAANYDEALGQNTSHTVDTPVAGANILATGFGTNNVIVEIPAGVTVRGGAETIAGYRMYFASGNREPSGGTVPQAGNENLTATGESIFLRAVRLALNGGVAPNLGEPVVITTQPAANTDACALLPMSLSVAATGQDPLSYQWYFSDGATFTNALAEGTRSTLTYASFDATNAGYYAVVISNAFGSVTSSVAAVNLVGTGTVASALINLTNCPGTAAAFTTTASGSGTLTYTWRKDGTVIQGPSAQNSYSIVSVTAGDAGVYSVEVAGQCNTVTNSATLTVAAAPTITAQPQNQTAPMGNGAVFAVAATDLATQPNTYQWQTNGIDVPGATGSSFAISNLTLAANGLQVRVAISNCAGGLISSVATLTVTPVIGMSFDFNTPGQYSNAPFNLTGNNWMDSTINSGGFNNPLIATVPFEVSTGGVGVATGGGALDLAFNNGTDRAMTLLPATFDFSLPGQTLIASIMTKIKAPVNGTRRAIQLAFVTTTNVNNVWQQVNANNGQGFMSAILQSTAAGIPPTFQLRAQHKLIAGTTPVEQTPLNSPTNQLATNNWYRFVAKFVNIEDVTASSFTVESYLQDMGPTGETPGAIVLGMAPITVANADIVNLKNLLFCIRGFEDGGQDYWDDIHVATRSGPAAFVAPPQSQTVLQGRTASFRALVDGDGPYTYQWNKNGSPIAGAGSWNYTTPPLLLSDDQADYTVTVTTTNGSITSAAAVVTVQADALNVLSVGSVEGSIIGLRFDQAVDKTSAETAANYTINGVPAVAAQLRNNNGQQLRTNATEVLITPAAPVSGAFTVAVANVTSLSGTSIGVNNTAIGEVAGLTGFDVDPASQVVGQAGTLPGYNYSFAPGQFEVAGGGYDIFGNFDGFRFVYKQMTGDFDLKVHIPYLDLLRTPNKGGFDARVSLDSFSPHVGTYANPILPGRNFIEGGMRQIGNNATTSWGNQPALSYPNVWLRFRRSGNTFLRYSSTDGVNWSCDGQTTPSPSFPNTLYVGFAVSANVGGTTVQQLVTSQFDSFGAFGGYPGATITLVSSPTNVTINAGSATTLAASATVSGGGIPAGSGELSYLWQRSDGLGGWTNLPTAGATNNTASSGTLYRPDNLAQFRVIISAPGALSVTSSVATVTVNDTAAPTFASAANVPGNPRIIVLNFNEPVSASSALNPINYTVTNSAGTVFPVASVSFLNGDPRTVVLTLVDPISGLFGVVVSGVQDLNGNTIVTAARSLTNLPLPTTPIIVEHYGNLPTTADLSALTNNIKFTANMPDFITFSNLFGVNAGGAVPTGPDNYGTRTYSYFVPPTTGAYKFWLRGDDFLRMFINTNSSPSQSTNPAGRFMAINMAANNANYVAANSWTSGVLNASQAYYIEVLMKETGGGDAMALAIRGGADNNVPPQAETAGLNFFAYPAAVAPSIVSAIEFYTGFTGSDLPSMDVALASPAYAARAANIPAYGKQLSMSRDITQTGLENYFGRTFSYFIPPTTGNYKFWVRSDDASQLLLNTNPDPNLSIDPAGATVIGQLGAYTAAYTVVAQNVSLNAGQRYYIEGRWKEGTGGDGMFIAVRDQSDAGTPLGTETIPANMLQFPTNMARLTPPAIATILPLNPTITDGQRILFTSSNVLGSGLVWTKNGVVIETGLASYQTEPLTLADDGAVFGFLVSNAFSVFTATSRVTVLPDNTAPVIVSAIGSQYGNSVLVTFNEVVDPTTAGCLANYSIAGLTVLGVDFDDVRRNRVSLRTSPQAPNTSYTLTVNGVKDASSVGNATAGATINFNSWTVGGNGGVLVEMFLNIPGTSVDSLFADPRYIDNLPDVRYYTNNFGVGRFQTDTGLQNYGARVTGLFTAPSNGLYQFFIRGDDGTRLFMNTNGPSPEGRVLIARNDGANSAPVGALIGYQTGLGLGTIGASASPILTLTGGTSYFLEGFMKEGGGGDYLQAAIVAINPGDLTPIGGYPTTNVLNNISGSFFGAPGSSDLNRLLVNQTPPAELSVQESDPVQLSLVATLSPPSLSAVTVYQWQRSNSLSGTFTNVPGANAPTLSFFAPLADDGAAYRLTVAFPGTNAAFETLLHVSADAVPPFILSANSLDGTTIGVRFNEPVDLGTGGEPSNYLVDGVPAIAATVRTNIDPRTVILIPQQVISGPFTVEANVADSSVAQNFGSSSMAGSVQNLTPMDIGSPAGAGSSFTDTNNQIEVIAGGNDIWGASDSGHMVLGTRSGDFDIWVRLNDLTRAPGDPDGITKAGLMVRETLDPGARKLHYLAEPPASIGGRDIYEAGQRPTVNANTAAWAGGNGNVGGPAGIPNTWIRIKRSGNLFSAFRSTNGTDWTMTTTQSMVFSNSVYVGLAATAHLQPATAPNPAATVKADFRDLHIPNPPSITVQPTPASQTIPIHAQVSYSVTAANQPNSGSVVYQWRRNNVLIAGATNSTFTLTNAAVADAGLYTVSVGNDGGVVFSDVVSLLVSNALITVTNDSISTTQGVAVTFAPGSVSANDTDPEGDPISVVGLVGSTPFTFGTNFDAGNLSGATLYGNAFVDTTGGVGGSGVLKITTNAVSLSGSMIINELIPGKRINAFTASFNLRIADGSAEPADGFSFNFAGDLPDAAVGTRAAEDGLGTGFSFCVDNYRFAPYPAGGTANTSGMKIRYNNVDIAGVQIPAAWNNPAFIPVSISVTRQGDVTVLVDGTNVFGAVNIPFPPSFGRFGIFARTGGQFQSHSVDDLQIDVTSPDVVNTALGGLATFSGTEITYTPPAAACGLDFFHYMVTDGQSDGTVLGKVDVNVACLGGPITIIQPSRTLTTFTASFNTAAGVNYEVRYKNNIDDLNWTTLTVISGDGTVKSFTDNGPLPATRFYRVFVP